MNKKEIIEAFRKEFPQFTETIKDNGVTPMSGLWGKYRINVSERIEQFILNALDKAVEEAVQEERKYFKNLLKKS